MAKPSGGSADTVRRWAQQPPDVVFAELKSGPDGLSTVDAARRLEEHGFNVLPGAKKTPLSRKALAQFKNLFNVLLLIAAALSFATGTPTMGFAIIGVVIVAVLFSLFQERRAERAVEALRQLVPEDAKVMRDGAVKKIPVSYVTPGDIVTLEEGDKVPADARLLTAFDVDVDNSTLTGESEPQRRTTASIPQDFEGPITECSNLVFAGTVVTAGTGTAVVIATGKDTQFGQVVAITRAVEEPLSPLQLELDHAAKLNFYVAIGVGLVFLAIGLVIVHLPVPAGILFMIGVMTSLVPEGLQITVTLSLAMSSLALSKRNVVVKRLSSVETLGSTTVICTDKTGTITEGQMTVRKAWIGGRVYDVSGEGYEPEGAVLLGTQKVTAADRSDLRRLCEIAALNNKATLVPPLDRRKSRWTMVGDSTEAALLVLAAKANLDPKKTLAERPRVGMIPFESARKMMTSVHTNPEGGIIAYVKGAGREVLARSTSVLWGGETVPMTDERGAAIRGQIDAFARDAYRVLALAFRIIPAPMDKYESSAVESELTFVGLVAILDPPRADVPRAVYKARSAGMRVIMMTGDHELTAEAIARKVGIITSAAHAVVTGYDLVKLTDDQLSKVLETQEIVFARITPEQKLRVVRILRNKGETVAVTGDGVNDAPALLEADIGIAMGITGTDVARETADMVLLDDNFASIVGGTELGRSVFDNLRKFIVYVFGHNCAELTTFVFFVLFLTPQTLPLTVVGVLAIDIAMDIPPSLALTLEPPEPGIMERPPRPKDARLFDLGTLSRSFYIGTMIGLAALFWCFSIWSQAGWRLGLSAWPSTPAQQHFYIMGSTAVIAGIMAGQLGTLFATRTNVKSAFTLNPLRNRWLFPSLGVELAILLAIVYLPFMQTVFATSAFPLITWLYLYSFVPVILLFEEVRKYVVRTVLLPARVPAPAVAVVPPAAEVIVGAEAEARTRIPFIERGPPILVPLTMRGMTESAVAIALGLAEYSGSRLVLVRLPERGARPGIEQDLEGRIEQLAKSGDIPYSFVDLPISEGRGGRRALGKDLERLGERTKAETVVVPVDADFFSGGRAQRRERWIADLRKRRVILVRGPGRTVKPPSRLRRLLIPVLDEFQPEPFDVAASLTATSAFPSVDVVAAKVIKMPQIVPLYSTYRPESLIDQDRELSFLKALRAKPIMRLLTPKILIVRDIGRDLVEFAEERDIEVILMAGRWQARRHGFLTQDEQEVALKAKGIVVVILPPAKSE
jgi:magnesium-transporting ATPase (P-type)